MFQRTRLPWAMLALSAVALPLAVPLPYYLHLAIIVGIYAIVLLGMDLLVGYTGQVSLGHAAFFGIGAYAAGLLMTRLGLPFGLALLAAAAIAAGFGVLLAAAALRVSGPYLAMVTLAFGTIVQILINEMDWLTLGPIGLAVDKPRWFGEKLTTTQYYYVVWGFVALALVCTGRWASSHLGRAFEALRDSPIATECMGIGVARYKAIAFALSAAMAGIGGALYAVSEEYISPNTYNFELSLLFLLGVIFGGRKSRAGSLLGATVVVMLPTLLDSMAMFRWLAAGATAAALYFAVRSLRGDGAAALRRAGPPLLVTAGMLVFSYQVQNLNEHRLSIFGLLILLAVFYLPDGLMGLFKARPQGRATTAPSSALLRIASEPKALGIRDVTMRFGGLTALDSVSLDVQPGTIHGLIGPNGSGKSTMMNVLTGVYTPTAGRVLLAGRPIQGTSPARIASQGIARTFQNVQLFWEMTALQNVKVGLHRGMRSGLLALALDTRAAREHEAGADAQAMALLELVGLAGDAATDARDLPYGKQRLLEIARALALQPAVLLLDEPAAGLTAPDVAALMQVLRKVKGFGVTMVLIEHHMDIVMALCDAVTVLDFGQKISEGQAHTVRNDPRVISAYLGTAAA
ncbi:ABC transporter permease subunit [Pseudorhodoferax soli]|uniref:Amino acid/amide ABC transporter membrane protein 2 (HAAT family) /amino acid/amide ABC transporter ATP-binding protein 1 (HAAT family) n=1 Tax=Pseudorhodoferax soli TaxID=545864 RepID=A0A368Y241_9BURK|nr:branched-chain amino acid ABC transporter ATP-binding protein/permease [Pseudorhodoferax soli]RCW72867.1 amino acid/amide ABC transporter membrane protein 2 (HAAT family) /amino acid/amide ABC transporter ATP-binding protein 1 (HAAT family) [Pseudorhodoferax soli]